MVDFHAQVLANTAWAFATLGQSDVKLFAALGRAATWCVGDFNVQVLVNIACAFATASSSDAQVFAALARAAELRMGDFYVQDLANTAWAFAKASQQDVQLRAEFSRVAELRLGDLKALKPQKLLGAHVDPQVVAMLMWSSAQLQMLSKCLANTILKETRARLHEFSPCSLTSIV